MPLPIHMPQLGLSMTEGVIVDWLKAAGESVEAGESVLIIETDKATHEIEAPVSGVVERTLYPAGKTVAVGEPIAYLSVTGESSMEPAQSGPREPTVAAKPAPNRDCIRRERRPERQRGGASCSPRAKRLAEAHGIDIRSIAGSGPEGRIQESDVQACLDRMQPNAQPRE